VALRARAEADGRLVRVLDLPVVEAVDEMAVAAVQGEEALRALAAEGLDLPVEQPSS
jgi:hypothetical protein